MLSTQIDEWDMVVSKYGVKGEMLALIFTA